MRILLKSHTVIPGFGLALGFTVLYLVLIVLIPLSGLFFKTATSDWAHIIEAVTSPRVVAAYRITFIC